MCVGTGLSVAGTAVAVGIGIGNGVLAAWLSLLVGGSSGSGPDFQGLEEWAQGCCAGCCYADADFDGGPDVQVCCFVFGGSC